MADNTGPAKGRAGNKPGSSTIGSNTKPLLAQALSSLSWAWLAASWTSIASSGC